MARLQGLYFDGQRQTEHEPMQQSFKEEVLLGLNEPLLALDLHLDADVRRFVGLRASGAD